MKLAVIAADGKTGRAVVRRALDSGDEVVAGVYSDELPPELEGATVVHCDATQQRDVAACIAGADAVVTCIGHTSTTPPSVQSDAMRVIGDAMRSAGITRLVSVTGTGVRFDGDSPHIIDRIANAIISRIDPARIADGKRHVTILQQGQLDWTVIRVLKLTNGRHPMGAGVTLSLEGPAELFTPRERVAAAILQVLHDGSFLRQSPIVQGKK